MKLTCLSRGKGFYFPPCHMLNVCGFRILIDCPLDLSALAVFAPIPPGFSAVQDEEDFGHSVGESDGCESGNEERKNIEKPMDAKALIRSEPWYKTVANLHLWNLSFIDVVLISSPSGMLGLPFLTRAEGFSAKIYVTEAAAKLGKLMMEDLVSMHEEFRQFYGSEELGSPHWMKWEELESLPSAMKEIVLGTDGIELGGWMPLYRVPLSAADIEDCAKKAQKLKYAEVACYNGTINIKPISSGLEIGACNWTIRYPDGTIAFVSSSEFVPSHALEFNYNALRSCDVLIYSDFSSLDILETANKGSNYTAPEDSSTSSDLEELLLHADESSEEMDKLNFICSCAVDAVKAGGSVLIPIGRLGIMLQLLEQISICLESSQHKVPIFVISSVAEELLAYTNIIPEWVCKQRQEKLFSGESLFAHVELLNGERLQVYPAIYSPKLLLHWQEPCIVFCPHWSLRLGPAVHLLRRWHGDEKSLLIWEEGMDSDIALLPFEPKVMKMKVLRCSFLSGIVLKKVQPLIHILQPKFLLPEDFRQQIISPVSDSYSVLHYSVNETLKLPTLKEGSELEITADVISRLHWKNLQEQNLSITRLKGNLVMCDARRRILYSDELPCSNSEPPLLSGALDLQKLLTRLSEMGIGGSLQEGSVTTDGLSDARVLRIDAPSEALLEIRSTSTIISAANEELAFHIRDAVNSILDGT
ncbi:integrator complex subunit 9 isoform X2 [Rhodamnia argentea]|uniref:Integrator complex subunit 9 isoform X2 n=1 Tax=Rhodamnia argentea TaxID=178133 RepID=A0ABM3HVS6_9MYRT|nr:integrator complex subunit 9 isoform X2 [Rhodamnia argentea]